MAFSNLCYMQIRTNTVNFFMRRRQDELWKTITSVSSAGQKKGRRTTRQPRREVRQFYRIGQSPIKINFPGLNAPLKDNPAPIYVEESTEEELEKSTTLVRSKLESMGKTSKRRIREKLHPLERGFSGGHVVGQKFGAPPPAEGIDFNDFQTYCLEVSIFGI